MGICCIFQDKTMKEKISFHTKSQAIIQEMEDHFIKHEIFNCPTFGDCIVIEMTIGMSLGDKDSTATIVLEKIL